MKCYIFFLKGLSNYNWQQNTDFPKFGGQTSSDCPLNLINYYTARLGPRVSSDTSNPVTLETLNIFIDI